MLGRGVAAAAVAVAAVLLPAPPAVRADLAGCPSGTTLLVPAHPDDDLLFMSPDLLHEIRAGRCVRTLYLTAGDANLDRSYWSGREAGVEAAYAAMAGERNRWESSETVLAAHPVQVRTLVDDPRVSLAFLRLPDGLEKGTGGSGHGRESLQKLWQARIGTIHPVDGSAPYTRKSLRAALTAAMRTLRPGRILAGDDLNAFGAGDHSDHYAAAYFAGAAQRRYSGPHTFVAFRGYPVRTSPPNISGADLAAKTDAFLAYAEHDPRVCGDAASCSAGPIGGYLSRQYRAVSVTGTVHPNELRSIGRARQVLTITAKDRSSAAGTAVAWQARAHVWHVAQRPVRVHLGGRGLVLPGHRRQLTGKTPAGTFRPARAMGFRADPGTGLPFRRLTADDYWPYDPRSPRTYNVFQPHRSRGASWRRALSERFAAHRHRYPWAVLMDVNLPRGIHHSRRADQREASVPANVRKGSLWIHAGAPVGRLGWISMPTHRIERLLRWMRPKRERTTFVVGTPAYLRKHL